MFCTECGKELPDGVRFCPVCGHSFANAEGADTATPVAQEATPSAGEAATAAAPSPDPAPKKSKVAQIVVASVVAVVAVLGIGVFAYLQLFSGTPVDEEHFPDEKFRSFVASNIDTDGDGKLTAQEIEQATVVDLTGQTGIADVTGVAVFTNMESFNLGANKVAEVDLSQNTHVTQVSTGAGSAEDLKLPSGFDMQAGLDGAAGTKVEAGDVTVQADGWTSDNNGKFGPLQRYNGVLYAGMLHMIESHQLEIKGATIFFGNTDHFYFVNDKAYWTDNDPGSGSNPVSLYSANIDGTNKKTLAQGILSHTDLYYLDNYIFFEELSNGKTWFSYVDVQTGEKASLPATTSSLEGICDGKLVITLKSGSSSSTAQIALFDPSTKNVESASWASLAKESGILVSEQGILVGSTSSASLFKTDGTPIWSNKPLFNQSMDYREAFYGVSADSKKFYRDYGLDETSKTFRLEIVDQISTETSYVDFTVPELTNPSMSGAKILLIDGGGAFLEVDQMRKASSNTVYIYYVPFNGDEPVCLQQYTAG